MSSPNDYPGLVRRSVKTEVGLAPASKSVSNGTRVGLASSDKENERVKKELAKIDAMELSDLESPKWETKKHDYAQVSQKRHLDVEDAESSKRKVSGSSE